MRDAFRTGAHAIKIMTSGGVISLTDPLEIPQYSPEEICTITSEASRRGSYVCAHAYSVPAIRHSVENGVRSIEHGNLLDADTAKLMAEHDAFLVPTLAAYAAMDARGEELGLATVSQEKNRIVLERGQQAVRHALDAGVKVGFGSDLMGELGDEQLNGLALQAAASSVEDLLRSATGVNAQLIGNEFIGSLAAGKAADLLVLDGDPRQDVDFLVSEAKGRTVIQAGARSSIRWDCWRAPNDRTGSERAEPGGDPTAAGDLRGRRPPLPRLCAAGAAGLEQSGRCHHRAVLPRNGARAPGRAAAAADGLPAGRARRAGTAPSGRFRPAGRGSGTLPRDPHGPARHRPLHPGHRPR
ncbi:amidohydrolase family protein [Arthrobacter sp. JCM 19049]|uniref:amidohydrolase family protein n=1 Tax=Arthrobacter sp. JCM 19049 TaxID=1460643 RepID=UPI002436B737|nr:amidohydrolase family protein [Arthrobacter sp. JCM 19049]